MRLHRPYIPVKVRLAVAERQVTRITTPNAFDIPVPILWRGDIPAKPPGKRLQALLRWLFGDRPYQLHHDPALVNRRRSVRRGRVVYDPPANDPAHLVYLEKPDHGIVTRVRGFGARRSDLGERRYQKRVERNRAVKVGDVVRLKKRGKVIATYKIGAVVPKRKWPSRPWPKRRMR